MKIQILGSMGDEVGITGMVREYKRRHPGEIVRIFKKLRPEIWENNPYLDWGDTEDGRLLNCYSWEPKHDGPRTLHYCLLGGLKREEVSNDLPELYFTQEELDWRPEGLELGPDCVAIDPGAGWFSRQWPEEKYHFLSAALREKGFRVFNVGSKGGRPLEGSVDVTTRRLGIRKTALFLSLCGLYVGNDSGLFHLAAAVGTPHVTVYGVSRRAAGPYSTTVAVNPPSECDTACGIRCLRRGALPPPYNFCMQEITVQQVLEACGQALQERRGAGRVQASVTVIPDGSPLEAVIDRLGGRAAAARRMVALARERRALTFVESRVGGGTPLLARLASDAGGMVYSVDGDRTAIYVAAKAVGPRLSRSVSFACGDPVELLRQQAARGSQVDLAHLDAGADAGAAARQARELQAIYPALMKQAIVVLGLPAGEAGARLPAESWLAEGGWRCEVREAQSVWVRS